jgi:hypothetical protein
VSNIANFSSRVPQRPHHAKNAGGRNLVGQRCEKGLPDGRFPKRKSGIHFFWKTPPKGNLFDFDQW